MRIANHRAARAGLRIVAAGPQKHTVGISAGLDRSVIGIADGKRLGERVLKRNIRARVIAQRMIVLGRGPMPEPAMVPGLLCIRPAMRGAFDAHEAELCGRIQCERCQPLAAVLAGLQPYRARGCIRQWRCRNRKAIAKPANAGQGAKVMIERAVFLHQDHHVLQILQRAAAAVWRDGCGTRDAGQQRCRPAGKASLQQAASGQIDHVGSPHPRGNARTETRCEQCIASQVTVTDPASCSPCAALRWMRCCRGPQKLRGHRFVSITWCAEALRSAGFPASIPGPTAWCAASGGTRSDGDGGGRSAAAAIA